MKKNNTEITVENQTEALRELIEKSSDKMLIWWPSEVKSLNQFRESLLEWETLLTRDQTALTENQTELSNQQEQLSERKIQLKERESKLLREQQELHHQKLETEQEGRDNASLKEILANKESALRDQESELGRRQNQISLREQEVAADFAKERQDHTQKLNEEINKDRDQRLQALNEEITTKREAASQDETRRLATLTESLEKQEAQFQSQWNQRNQLLEQRQQELDEFDESLKQRQKELNSKETTLTQKEEEQTVEDGRLQEIETQLHKDKAFWQANLEKQKQANQARFEEERDQILAKEQEKRAYAENQVEQYKEVERQTGSADQNELLLAKQSLEEENAMLIQRRDLDKKGFEQTEKELVEMKDGLKEQLSGTHNELGKLRVQQQNWEQDSLELENFRLKEESLENQKISLAGEVAALREQIDRLREAFAETQNRKDRISTIENPLFAEDELKIEIYEPANLSEEGDVPTTNEMQWLEEIHHKIEESKFAIPKRLLHSFHTSLKTSEMSSMTVLAGVSGTGKSMLPKLYSRFGGLLFLPVEVQPDWDSIQSLLGFYNQVENRFNPSDLLRLLVQAQFNSTDENYQNGFLNERLCLVLLDEMNLAHPELYFSDFLSKLEQRRGENESRVPKLSVDLGAGVDKYSFSLSRNILWTGSMNQDETTKALSVSCPHFRFTPSGENPAID